MKFRSMTTSLLLLCAASAGMGQPLYGSDQDCWPQTEAYDSSYYDESCSDTAYEYANSGWDNSWDGYTDCSYDDSSFYASNDSWNCDDDGCSWFAHGWDSWNDCCTYDPCCTVGPLRCGSIGVQIGGGWCPINNTHKGKVWLTIPGFLPSSVFSVSRIPQFRTQFNTPWIVNGLATYNLTDHVQLFGELNYRHATGKNRNYRPGPFYVREEVSNFRSWAWYIGGRYFFDRLFCDSLSPFIGFKTGLVRTHQVSYDVYLAGIYIENGPYWYGNTGVSGGLQIGADYALTDHIGIIFTVEAVATQGMKPNSNNVLDPLVSGGLTNVNFGDQGIQMSYPITLGVRYNF